MAKKKSKKQQCSSLTKKIVLLLGVIALGFIIFWLVKILILDKNCEKVNISTDEKQEYIMLEGEQEKITTKKYISDLNYSMRYDIDSFKVIKYKGQDIYIFLYNDLVFLTVEKSIVPKTCSSSDLDISYSNCYIKVDNSIEEYYISLKDAAYKITVKSPNTTEYQEGIRKRITHMIDSFEIKDK